MMTRQGYELLAEQLSYVSRMWSVKPKEAALPHATGVLARPWSIEECQIAREVSARLLNRVCIALARDNPRFNERTFLKACGWIEEEDNV